jgi:SNF2 family DNA or RNA helicase
MRLGKTIQIAALIHSNRAIFDSVDPVKSKSSGVESSEDEAALEHNDEDEDKMVRKRKKLEDFSFMDTDSSVNDGPDPSSEPDIASTSRNSRSGFKSNTLKKKVFTIPKSTQPHATLVVAPISLLSQWHSELLRCNKYKPAKGGLRVTLYYGNDRGGIDDNDDVVITSYGTLASEWLNREKREQDETKGSLKRKRSAHGRGLFDGKSLTRKR